MLLTVTANTTLDQTLFVPKLELGRTNRARLTVQSMAGKPTDAAWILGKLGIPSIALGFAAGTVGERIQAMLRSRGVLPDFVQVGGESRMNMVLIDDTSGSHTTVTTSTLLVEPDHVAELRQKYDAALARAACVIMGGTLPQNIPPSFYTDLIAAARQRGVPVIFDADEPNLSAGLEGLPTITKPNEHELEHLLGYKIDSLETAYHAGRTLVEQYGTTPIITLGERGTIAVGPQAAYYVPPLSVDVVSPAGAGDGMLAGLAKAFLDGGDLAAGLRMGTAFATAVLLQPGTAEYDTGDYQRFLAQVEILPYPPSA